MDLVCAITHAGRVAGWYSRWGAVSLARDLLQGEAPFVAYAEGLHVLDPLEVMPWVSGMVAIDRDRRVLEAWLDLATLARSAWIAMMRERWPQWTIRVADDPCRMPGARPRPLASAAIDDVQQWQASVWSESWRQESVRSWCAEVGVVEARATLEWGNHSLWVTIVEDAVVRHDAWDPGTDCRALTVGPDALVAIVETRPALVDPLPWDGRFDWGAVVDVDRRTLSLWQRHAPFPDDLPTALRDAWPGWTLALVGDPTLQLRCAGLSPSAMWGPDTARELDEWFARLVGERQTGASILAKVAGAIAVEPGQRVTVTDPGSSDGPRPSDEAQLVDAYARWRAAHAPSSIG